MNESNKREHQQQHADIPVKLARLLVRTGEKDTEHVQPDRNHHQVRRPAMHVAQQLAERNIVLEIEHVAKRLHLAGVVIKHQHHAGQREHNKQVERDSAHTPGVAVTHCVPINFRRMQMQEDVRQHAQSAITRRVVVLVAKDRGVDLGLGRIFQAFNLLFRLCREDRS